MPAVSPIFIPAKGGDAELVGSGVLLRVGESEFVATAAHVMDIARHQLHIGSETRIVHVKSEFSNTTSQDGNRDSDRFDLALIPLQKDEVAQMEGARFLSLDELEPSEAPDHRPILGSKYFLLGFPATRQRRTVHDTVHVDPLLFSARAMESAQYVERGWSEQQHLMIEYDKKQCWTVDGQITAPDPYGVSGGGLFRVRGWFGEEPETETLVALPIRYTGKTGKSIVATRVNVLLDGLAQRYPHVRDEIRTFLSSRQT